MPVIYDTATAPAAVSTISLTWSHTCTGSDRALWVGIANAISQSETVSSVTYNGVTMNQAGTLLGTYARTTAYYLADPTSGAHDIIVTLTGADNDLICGAMSFTGVHQTVPIGTPVSAEGTTSSPATVDVSSASGEIVVDAVAVQFQGLTANQTIGWNTNGANYISGGGQRANGAASVTMSWAVGDPTNWAIIAAALLPSSEATWEQEGFRWRDDNGSETTADWLEAQDTAITRPISTNTRLRILVDSADVDPGGQSLRLEYKEDSEAAGLWRPIGQGLPGAVPTRTLLGSNSSATAAAASLQITVTGSTIQTGDLLILLMSVDGTISNFAGPADWLTIPGITNGPPGTDDTPYAAALYKIAVSADESATSYTSTWTTSQECAGVILRIPAGEFDASAPFSIAANGGISGTTGTAVPLSPSVVTTRANCLIIRAFAADDDDAASENDGSLSLAGGALFDLQPATNGPTLFGGSHSQAAAGASGTFTFALALAEEWASWTIAVQPALATAAITLAASGNISDTDEDTTFQLAAPSGKTTAAFGGGRIQDSTVTADAVDLALDEYGEWEWCLTATATAQTNDVYQFRVTRAGTVLDTYTVTPTWTIGTGAAADVSLASPSPMVAFQHLLVR